MSREERLCRRHQRAARRSEGSEHTHTWIDGAPRRAATNETLRRWDAPEFVSIHVEAGDITIRSADQADPLVIRSRVTGYGFPGAGGKTAVTRQGRSLIFTHRRERGQWEVHATFDVLVHHGIEVKIVATTREGRIRR